MIRTTSTPGRGRFGRFFDQGDLILVILRMIADQPRHGYELIKEVEEINQLPNIIAARSNERLQTTLHGEGWTLEN